MMVSHIEIVSFLVTIFLVFPFLWFSTKNNLWSKFILRTFIYSLNKSIKLQIIIGIVLLIPTVITDRITNLEKDLDFFSEIMVGPGYTYFVVFVFMYLPILLLLNLGVFVFAKKK